MEPILTSLATGVGTAIAKGTLKRWLKDYLEALGAIETKASAPMQLR